MLRGKMTIALFCILLIGHQVHAVVNKAQSQALANKEEENPNEIKADKRISNYGPPSDDYGPPIGSSIKGPVPVYGPPELVGNQGPTPIYPPPPPDIPPPIYGPPLASYGPPRNIKPLHGPPKQSFGPPLSSLPSKLNFGSLKLHYGPPKQHHGPSYSFGSFRLPKPQYGPPLKFTSNQYIAVGSSGLGPTKPAHGPTIPVPFDTYGVPPQKLAVQFSSQPSDNYGPPPPPSFGVVPESQYGPPAGDLHRPPVPPPGVPAPPTPPDIKYDGWQPIAGLANQQPTNIYGPPSEEHKIIDGSSLGLQLPQSTNNVIENPNVPSDSYGVPIHNPEAQDLKISVKSNSNDNKGLPPPPLPEYEPFHNESPPKKEPQKNIQGGINLQYEVPKVEPLSIVKTVGFELLPTNPSLTSDLTAGLPTLKLPLLDTGVNSHFGNGHSHAFQNLGNDLSLSLNGPSNSYGPPLSSISFGKLNSIESGIPLPPPALDSYGAPPLSSYSPNGPYPAAEAGRAASFSSFGLHGNVLFKQNLQHYRPPGSFRHPLSPPGILIPPRNREPIKFKESIPSGLLTNLNRYLPPLRHTELAKTPKTYLSPLSPFEQQLPIHNAPVAFKKLPSVSLNSPMAAPNAQYGTPLSFGDFNTPAPVLTYGAPNFGPASSFVSSSAGFGNNLYDGISNAITTTYGTPVVNLPLSTGGGHDCGLQQTGPGTRYSFEDLGSHSLNIGPSFGAALPAGLNQNSLFKVDSLSNALSGLDNTQSIGQLSLQNFDQPKTNLKDSYGSSIGVSYIAPGNADNVVSSDHSQSTNVLSALPAVQSQHSFSSNAHFQRENNGIRAEALTAGLELNQAKNLAANEVDASQFLNTHEGSKALSLVKGLTANGDGFEVQGSKGTYTLQIQAADGGLGTENSDGSIRHDQVLSNGLLQDILAAIEQPEQGQIQVQGHPEEQQLQHVYSNLPQAGNTEVHKGHYITVEQNNQRKDSNALLGQPGDNTEAESNKEISRKKEGVALFFNSQYGDSRKEIRSVTKNENVAAVFSNDGKNDSETKSS